MKNYKILFLFLLTQNDLFAQLKRPVLPDSLFSMYYHQRVSHFKSLPKTKGDIIFLGNSVTDGAEWSELFADSRIKNRGISGDITAGIIKRIDEVTERKPSKIFLMIGTNDLSRKISADSVIKNILWVADYVFQQSPSTKLFVQSILPVSDHTNKGELIKQVNTSLQLNASTHHYSYFDLYTPFCNADGKLEIKYTNDGLHLTGEGYLLWKKLIDQYVSDRK